MSCFALVAINIRQPDADLTADLEEVELLRGQEMADFFSRDVPPSGELVQGERALEVGITLRRLGLHRRHGSGRSFDGIGKIVLTARRANGDWRRLPRSEPQRPS